jgi:hypothetical protein
VFGVAEQEGCGHQRPSRNLLGDVGRREIAEFKIVTLQRDQLGTLLEQRVAPVRLEIEVVFDRGRELLVGLRAKVRFGEGAAEAQLDLGLRARGAAASEHDQRSGAGNDTAAGDGLFHCVLLQYSDFRCASVGIFRSCGRAINRQKSNHLMIKK